MTKYFIDLFAGAGGLSEGFINAGFTPICHVEKAIAATYTLKTRMAYHFLKKDNKLKIYYDYIQNKIDRDQLYSYIPNEIMSSVINQEISKESLSCIFNKIDSFAKGKNVDCIIGGPPCQAYSLIGRASSSNNMLGDIRNYLYIYYTEFLKRYSPKIFVFENVSGLLSAKDIDGELHLNKMIALFREYGYSVEYKMLNANDYGVLQNRNRLILIGKKGIHNNFYPEIPMVKEEFVVNDLFKDLPKLNPGEGSDYAILNECDSNYLFKSGIRDIHNITTLHKARKHNTRDLEIYKIAVELWNKDKKRLNYNELPQHLQNHNNTQSFTDRFKVVAGDLPASHTIVAHISKDGHYYIHPDINQNRSLTPREAARVQSFPDNYHFESENYNKPSKAAAFNQIGNAVPVLMAMKIGQAVGSIL